MSARPHARDCTAVFPRTPTAHEIYSEPCYAPLEECSSRLSYPAHFLGQGWNRTSDLSILQMAYSRSVCRLSKQNWYRRWDSNPYGFLQWFLRPLRLPFRHADIYGRAEGTRTLTTQILSLMRLPVSPPPVDYKWGRRESNPQNSVFKTDAYAIPPLPHDRKWQSDLELNQDPHVQSVVRYRYATGSTRTGA